MGGSKTQTTTQSSEPWSGQQPYLKDLFQQGQNLYNQGPMQYYPGQTVAPFSPQSQMGMDLMTQRALSGSPLEGAFGNYLGQTLGQPNLDPSMISNPAQQAAGSIGMGQNFMAQAGSGNPYIGGAANALGGMTGYGGLGEASQYAGSPAMGALPSSQQYVQDTLAQSPTFGSFADEIAGRTPGISGIQDAAQSQLAQTAQGGYLGSNPYLDQMFDTAAGRAGEAFNEQTMPGIAAMFGSGGRTGSGIQQQTVENAARQFGRDLQGMAADIYAPAYESERGRQTNAAAALGGLDLQGQGLAQSGALQGLGLAGDMYGGEQQRRLGAAGLGGDLFSQYNQADLGRLGLGSNLYLGERGLGQQAASNLGNLGLGWSGQQLGAGQGLANLGLGGIGAMGDLYGNIGQNQFRAGSLVPSFNDMQYGDIQRLLGVGGMVEDQSQRLMDANQNRWNYGQQAPWQNLQNYANIIYGSPSFGTTQTSQPGGSRLQGALGGAMAGSSFGPWGALGGAVLGGIL